MSLRAGDLLLSEPFMADPNFKRTVVLLCDYNAEGAFGLVLNRRLEYTLTDVLHEFPVAGLDLYYGGPVSPDTLHYIHRCGDLIEGSIHLRDDIWWGGNFEQIKLLFETRTLRSADFRFFTGYSGWGAGQLDEEMSIDSWIVDRSYSDIFPPDDQLWASVLRARGGEYGRFVHFPEDPSLN